MFAQVRSSKILWFIFDDTLIVGLHANNLSIQKSSIVYYIVQLAVESIITFYNNSASYICYLQTVAFRTCNSLRLKVLMCTADGLCCAVVSAFSTNRAWKSGFKQQVVFSCGIKWTYIHIHINTTRGVVYRALFDESVGTTQQRNEYKRSSSSMPRI